MEVTERAISKNVSVCKEKMLYIFQFAQFATMIFSRQLDTLNAIGKFPNLLRREKLFVQAASTDMEINDSI